MTFGFNWATGMDLNMGYLSMPLDDLAKEVTTIITQWGLYEHQVLPQGVMPATDIFQHRMCSLFADMENPPRVYIDDSLTTTKGSLDEHILLLDKIMSQLEHAGM